MLAAATTGKRHDLEIKSWIYPALYQHFRLLLAGGFAWHTPDLNQTQRLWDVVQQEIHIMDV